MGMHKILELELIAYYDESITVAVGGGGACAFSMVSIPY